MNNHLRYFCCNSCLIIYKQKYKGRIDAMNDGISSSGNNKI
jgi:hypothetical protein